MAVAVAVTTAAAVGRRAAVAVRTGGGGGGGTGGGGGATGGGTSHAKSATAIAVVVRAPHYTVTWKGKAQSWKVTLHVGKKLLSAKVAGTKHSAHVHAPRRQGHRERDREVRRLAQGYDWLAMPRVLILGAGFGGLELATLLSESPGDEFEVTLVDKSDAFVFGYSKLDVLFGRETVDAVRLPYREIAKTGVRFLRESVTAIDPETRTVTTDAGVHEADVLVVALGADYDLDATPGLADAGNEFYSVAGAERLAELLPDFSAGPGADRRVRRAVQMPAGAERMRADAARLPDGARRA